ncbi:hypothetical protein R3P38DRAFT_3198089 [Favolaschia claudopus]|uniref:Uncharacterized protein n=1 Tax=Favolaschia claudopus TaxID=2862362 RepID=A0AAW0B398_9AGAR
MARKISDMFNETLAFASARANITESTAVPQASHTSSKSTPASSSVSSVAPQTTTDSDTTGPSINQKQSNAIGGVSLAELQPLYSSALYPTGFIVAKNCPERGAVLNSPVMNQHQPTTLPSQPATAPVPSITVSSLHSQPASGSSNLLSLQVLCDVDHLR